MRVDDLRQETNGEWIVVSARMTWEDRDRPDQRIEFKIGKSLADDVECHANAFLVATATAAAHYGERRLAIDGKICPVLEEGVRVVQTQVKVWFKRNPILPRIEPSQGYEARRACTPRRAALLYSGGIDALATLRRNRLIYPASHPSSIRDCLHLFGMHPVDFLGERPCPKRLALWERNLPTMRKITGVADVELHLMQTNQHGLFDDMAFQAYQYHSATLLGLPHLLTRRLSEVSVASSDYLGDFKTWGSHPLLDPHYSSANLTVHHDGTRLTRLEKVRLLADWPEVLPLLNVCSSFTAPEVGMNCGRCEKCMRTMLELLICGKLEDCPTFPERTIDPKLLSQVRVRSLSAKAYMKQCIGPLRAMGRNDLANIVEAILAEFRAFQRKKSLYGLKPRIKQLDRKLLGGRLWSWKNRKRTDVPRDYSA